MAAPAAKTARVLHVINGEHYSGAERVQDLLAQQLPRSGFDVGFACVKPGRFPVVREAIDAPLVELPMRGRLDLRVVKKLLQLIRHEQYELVHAHTPRTAVVGRLAAREAGVPLVRSLNVLIEQQGESRARHLLTEIRESVQGGSTFAEALSKHPRVFPKLMASMVSAGERGGTLDEQLLELSNLYEREEVLKLHPDFAPGGKRKISIGQNKGDVGPNEVVDLLEAYPVIEDNEIDLSPVDYDPDILIIGGGDSLGR